MKTRSLLVPLAIACVLAVGIDEAALAGEKPDKKTVLASSATLLGMHADVREAVEEAFAYQLLNDAGEKKDFENKLKDFDKLAEKFKVLAGVGKSGHEEVTKGFENVMKARTQLQKSAENMFKEYEAKKMPDRAAAGLFEVDVDAFEDAVSSFVKLLIKEDVKDKLFREKEGGAAAFISMIHAHTMEAIQEALAYPLLKDMTEKKDYQDNMAKADKYIAALGMSNVLNEPGREKGNKLFQNMVEKKKALTAAAEKMFKDFEAKKKFTPDDVKAFEAAIDAFTPAFDEMVEEFLKEIM